MNPLKWWRKRQGERAHAHLKKVWAEEPEFIRKQLEAEIDELIAKSMAVGRTQRQTNGDVVIAMLRRGTEQIEGGYEAQAMRRAVAIHLVPERVESAFRRGPRPMQKRRLRRGIDARPSGREPGRSFRRGPIPNSQRALPITPDS